MSAPAIGAKVRKVGDPGYVGVFIKADDNGCWLIEKLDGERHWELAEKWDVSSNWNDKVTVEMPRWVASAAAEWTPVDKFPMTSRLSAACKEALGLS